MSPEPAERGHEARIPGGSPVVVLGEGVRRWKGEGTTSWACGAGGHLYHDWTGAATGEFEARTWVIIFLSCHHMSWGCLFIATLAMILNFKGILKKL